MTLADKIAQKEVEFFNENLKSPVWIIVNPYTLSELGDDDDTIDMVSYMGLRIAVSNHPAVEDFELA